MTVNSMKCCYLYGPMIMSWMPQKYFKLKLLLRTTTEPSSLVHYSGVPNSWGNTCSLWYENECSKSACVAHSPTPSGYACAKRLSKEGPKLSPHAVWVSQLIKRAKHSFRTKRNPQLPKSFHNLRPRELAEQGWTRYDCECQTFAVKTNQGKKGTPRGKGTLFANRALFEIEHDQLPGLHFFVVVGSKSVQHWPLSIAAAS